MVNDEYFDIEEERQGLEERYQKFAAQLLWTTGMREDLIKALKLVQPHKISELKR